MNHTIRMTAGQIVGLKNPLISGSPFETCTRQVIIPADYPTDRRIFLTHDIQEDTFVETVIEEQNGQFKKITHTCTTLELTFHKGDVLQIEEPLLGDGTPLADVVEKIWRRTRLPEPTSWGSVGRTVTITDTFLSRLGHLKDEEILAAGCRQIEYFGMTAKTFKEHEDTIYDLETTARDALRSLWPELTGKPWASWNWAWILGVSQ